MLRVELLGAGLALSKYLDINWLSWSDQVVGFDDGDNSSHHFQVIRVTTTRQETSQICIFNNIFHHFRKSTTGFATWTKRKKGMMLKVSRSTTRLFDHMAALLAHPLQRPKQRDTFYKLTPRRDEESIL